MGTRTFIIDVWAHMGDNICNNYNNVCLEAATLIP